MTLVRIVKNWDYPNLMLQTPNGAGVWNEVQFTFDPVEHCDAFVLFNCTRQPIKVYCPPQNMWAFVQEPPTSQYDWLTNGFKSFARVYTPNTNLTHTHYVHSHGFLPWHIGKSYDFLKTTAIPQKTRLLSSIASRETNTEGKKSRVTFLEALHQKMDFDLWGKGFNPVAEKWDALSLYQYALAIENYSGLHYWTEKISDCFLAWTMPIYYGATNITEYFPPESIIQIDITKPEEAYNIIHESISSGIRQKNIDAIACARELILEKYQIFPFLAQLLNENTQIHSAQPMLIHANQPPQKQSKNFLYRLFKKIQFSIKSLWVF